jgi:hypothetical protein
MWDEEVAAWVELPVHKLPEVTEKTKKKLGWDSWLSGRDSNWESSEYKLKVLLLGTSSYV